MRPKIWDPHRNCRQPHGQSVQFWGAITIADCPDLKRADTEILKDYKSMTLFEMGQ
jgi:hypothetical protein